MIKIPYFSIFIFYYSYVLFHRLGWQVKLPKMGKFRLAFTITDLDEEVMKIYPGSDFQLCTIHYTRGLKSKVKEKDVEIIEDANKMFKCNSKQEAITRFNEMKNKWENKYPNVIYNTERKLGQLLRFYDYPSRIRNSLNP